MSRRRKTKPKRVKRTKILRGPGKRRLSPHADPRQIGELRGHSTK